MRMREYNFVGRLVFFKIITSYDVMSEAALGKKVDTEICMLYLSMFGLA